MATRKDRKADRPSQKARRVFPEVKTLDAKELGLDPAP